VETRKSSPERFYQSLLALISGALLALSFPRYGHPAVAFIAVTPLFVALAGRHCRGTSARRGFVLGLMTGLVHFGGTVYWTHGTVTTYGGLPMIVGVLVAGLLVLFMSLYIGLASAASAEIIRRFGPAGLMIAPAAWVAAEYLRGNLFGGFPWIPLGNSVVRLLPLAQVSSLVGVYGLSWLLATLHACFALAALSTGRTRISAVVAALVIVTGPSVWGSARIDEGSLVRDGSPLKIALIQANIPQEQKWDPRRGPAIFDRYVSMTRQAIEQGAQFVLWPESSTPFFYEEDQQGAEAMRQLVRSTGTPLLFGSDQIEYGTDGQARYYNAAFMLDPAGSTAAVYRKMYLVPFGEYVPFKQLLFFVGPLVEAVSDFSPGTDVTMLPVHGHKISTAICYEVVYPDLMRKAVRAGSELLTTITNDAWYGTSSAPYQHFELASMRAIEQGRYLARAANTGISGLVDPYGRVLVQTNVFETIVVVGDVRVRQELTVYARIGDVAPQAALFLTLMTLAAALIPAGRGFGFKSRREVNIERPGS
jgi:apolipoprotein N-acyltransferase